jgi:two-component system NtrC family response regulator
MARILIIDDEPILCEYLSAVFRNGNHEVLFVHTLKDGTDLLSRGGFDAVFLDVGLPDGNGLSGLRQMQDAPSSPQIIIITGAANRAEAEIAIKNGAWDYIQKPFTAAQINDCLSSVLQFQRESASNPPPGQLAHKDIIGDSSQMKRCLAQLAPAAFSDASVLISGETGTGKELFARAIHDNSFRKSNNFVIVDCAALPEPLVESTLFGHEKGAFTSADQAQEGLVKQAHNGTLFLDEVGELPLSIQRSFLRVLQEHRFRPVGSQHEIESNFKLIAATNQDLDKMVGRGAFRRDLLFRLRSIAIDLPTI